MGLRVDAWSVSMNIGYFFNNPEAAHEAALNMYNMMSRDPEGNTKYTTKTGVVTYYGNKHNFIVISEFKDVQRISGIEFDGIFIKANFTDRIDRYILSRFRPRCSCKG